MFLKNKNIIFKIRRSKVTDYAALKLLAGKGLVSSVASFLSLWSLLSHSYFYECACSTDGL